jgi:hypothetical protein
MCVFALHCHYHFYLSLKTSFCNSLQNIHASSFCNYCDSVILDSKFSWSQYFVSFSGEFSVGLSVAIIKNQNSQSVCEYFKFEDSGKTRKHFCIVIIGRQLVICIIHTWKEFQMMVGIKCMQIHCVKSLFSQPVVNNIF